MTRNELIENEITQFKGTTFSSNEEALRWLREAFVRVSNASMDAVNVRTKICTEKNSVSCIQMEAFNSAITASKEKRKLFTQG